MQKLKNKLKELTLQHAIASNEKQVVDYLTRNLKGHVFKDRLGSVIAQKGEGRQVLLTAPMDEAGMIITQITKDGFIKFQPVGPLYVKTSLAQSYVIHTKDKTFLAIMQQQVITSNADVNTLEDVKTLYLDAGFKSDAEALNKGVEVGDMITKSASFSILENDQITSKAIESRAAVLILSELLEAVTDNIQVRLNTAFTVQHKMHMKGAKTSSFMIEPEIAISIDTIDAQDVYRKEGPYLGKGPVIYFYDQGLIAHQGLRNYLIELCKTHQIPYQEGYNLKGMNEGHYLQLSKLGAATLSIGIPIRNKYSHQEMVDFNDLVNTIKLLKVFIESLNDKKVENILFES